MPCARRRIWSEAELDDLRGEIVHRRFHVLVEIKDERVVLQVRPERFFVVGRRHQKVIAGSSVNVLQKSDESLALIGFAAAPAGQCDNKQNGYCAADSAFEN